MIIDPDAMQRPTPAAPPESTGADQQSEPGRVTLPLGVFDRPADGTTKGVVYTRPWVVELLLDLAGYRPERDLVRLRALEPSAGQGAFLAPMARRLARSLRAHGRPAGDAIEAIEAWELDASAAAVATRAVIDELVAEGVAPCDAAKLAGRWLTVGDHLLAPETGRRADVVVGNPPYIRYDDLPAERYRRYQSRYPTMAGRCDLYVGFIEAGIRRLAPGGALAFICADRWMRAAYGARLRDLVTERCSVEVLIEMHDASAFTEAVAAYPAVIVLRRAEQGPVVVARAGRQAGHHVLQESSMADALADVAAGRRHGLPGFTASTTLQWFSGDRPWPSLHPGKLGLLSDLEREFRELEDGRTGTRIGIGVATGNDRVFIARPGDPIDVEEERLLPLALASDTRTGEMAWSGHRLVNPWEADGDLADLDRYPRLASYLHTHRSALSRRHVVTKDPARWYRTIDRIKDKLQDTPKLYFPDMKLHSNATLDRGTTYPHHGLYYLTTDGWDLEVLGGLLLSRIAELFVEAYCTKMRGGTLRFQAQHLRRIRVPPPESLSPTTRTDLVQAFRERDRHEATLAACDAYGLDPSALS